MEIAGIWFEPLTLIIAGIVLILLIALIIIFFKPSKSDIPDDLDNREEYGDFHGLLSPEDFDCECDNELLEIYRRQWIRTKPGDEKDNHLLLYLSYKQLLKEQEDTEEEWTEKQCEERLDEIIEELSQKTGLKLIVEDLSDDEFNTYFADDEAPDTDEIEEETSDEEANSEEN